MVPGFACLPFRDPDQKQRQITQKDVSADPLFFSVIERPQVECRLKRPERPLHFRELFVAKSYVFGRERIVGSREKVLAVQRLFLLDLGQVDSLDRGDPVPRAASGLRLRHLAQGLPQGLPGLPALV